MMQSRAVFLDRDGTINKDSGYINKPSQVRLFKNTGVALQKLQDMGFLNIVISNQSGVGRGYLTMETLQKITRRLEDLLDNYEVKIVDFFYAPYYEKAIDPRFRTGAEDRKPNTGMVKKAQEKYNIDVSGSYLIGDKDTDIILGNRVGAVTILVRTGQGRYTENWLRKQREFKADYIAKDLLDAAIWIEQREKNRIGVRRKIKSWLEVRQAVHRRRNRRIVFTNGCFDILHYGHIDYLERASHLGQIFVVGVNSDDSVRRLKGALRPILDEKTRTFKLAALEFVDFVTVFEQDTPQELIEYIKPDVLVKGGDYKNQKVVGADIVERNGGEVVLLDFIEGYSTTKIIESIRQGGNREN